MTDTATRMYVTGARNAVLLGALEQVLSAAAKADIPVLALKGAVLCALGVYKTGEREFCDLDLLLKKKDLPRFTALLPALNYERTPDGSNDFVLKGAPDSFCLPALDLHAEPFQFSLEYARQEELIWAAAQPLEIGAAKAYAPSAEWLLLIALLNPLLHDACLPVKAVEDARRITQYFKLDWEVVRDLSDKLRVRPPLEAALKRLELEGVAGCPAPRSPETVLDKLFFKAACRSEPSKMLQYLLPAALSPRAALGQVFADREYFAARGLSFSMVQRIKRPLFLLRDFLKALFGL